MKQKSSSAKEFLVVIIPGIAFALAAFMIFMGNTTAEEKVVEKVTLVEATALEASTQTAVYEVSGTMKPDQEVIVSPEIKGKVTWVNPNMIPGGNLKKGEILFKLDQRDAKLRVKQQKSAVKAAEIALEKEIARGEIAKREWELSGEEGEANPLASRKLLLESAQLSLESAKSMLLQAQINLERTVIRAPFHANVASEKIDLGQVVSGATQAARLVGNQNQRLEISVPVEILNRVNVTKGKKKGSRVDIVQKTANGVTIERTGYVQSIVGEVDSQNRRVKLTVKVPKVNAKLKGDELPLLPGSFVSASIRGDEVEGIYKIPRKSIHDGKHIWTITPKKTLLKKEINILWTQEDFAFCKLDEKRIDLVTSTLAAPVNGLKVTLSSKQEAK